MQLEEANAVEITKLVECVDSREDPLMQISRMYQHNINSAVLQTARRVKTEVERGTRQIKHSRKNKERWGGLRMNDNCRVP